MATRSGTEVFQSGAGDCILAATGVFEGDTPV